LNHSEYKTHLTRGLQEAQVCINQTSKKKVDQY